MIRNLFGRKPEPPPELSAALADLDRLAASRPELEAPARSLGRVLGAAFGAPPRLRHPHGFGLDSPRFEEVRRGWSEGEPAFLGYPPAFDPGDLRARAEAILRALKPDNPAASILLRVGMDWADLAGLAIRGEDHAIGRRAGEAGIPIDLVQSVVRLTVLPALAPLSLELAAHRPEGIARDGRCPHCGRLPSLAESRGLEGARFLRCALCAADWPGRRIGCVACGEADWRAVRSLSVEGEGSRARLVACDACGFRLKVVSTLAPLSAPGLIVADLATVHLDLIDEGPGG